MRAGWPVSAERTKEKKSTRHKWIKGYNSFTSFKTNGNLAWPKRRGQNVILQANEEIKKAYGAGPAVSLFLYICTCVETISWPLNIWLYRKKKTNCFPKWSAGMWTILYSHSKLIFIETPLYCIFSSDEKTC